VFAAIGRVHGSFPAAQYFQADGIISDIIVWCSNDYLGMGSAPKVLSAMHEAIDRVGVAFESVYSLDGDIAPIGEICHLAHRYNATCTPSGSMGEREAARRT
jgi:7-keto-8-aminopelargonate synthetase-like enzyme